MARVVFGCTRSSPPTSGSGGRRRSSSGRVLGGRSLTVEAGLCTQRPALEGSPAATKLQEANQGHWRPLASRRGELLASLATPSLAATPMYAGLAAVGASSRRAPAAPAALLLVGGGLPSSLRLRRKRQPAAAAASQGVAT